MYKLAKKLTTTAREHISEGNFALPGRRYPIHDLAHARNALARVAQHGTPAEQSSVRRAVYAKYPALKERSEERDNSKEASQGETSMRPALNKKAETAPEPTPVSALAMLLGKVAEKPEVRSEVEAEKREKAKDKAEEKKAEAPLFAGRLVKVAEKKEDDDKGEKDDDEGAKKEDAVKAEVSRRQASEKKASALDFVKFTFDVQE